MYAKSRAYKGIVGKHTREHCGGCGSSWGFLGVCKVVEEKTV